MPTAGKRELKLGEVVTTIPTIDSQRGNRGVPELELHRAEGQRDDSLRSQMRNEDLLLLEGGPVRILGGTWTEGFGEETLGAPIGSDSESPEDR